MDLLLAHVLLFIVSAVVCLAVIPQARTIQHEGTRTGLVALLSSVALWSAGYAGYLLAPTDATRITFYIFGFVFAFVAVGAWLYFCAAYTGRPPSQAPYKNSAIVLFLVITLLKVTNPLHELYFTTAWVTEPFPHLAIQHGLLYWIVLGASYAVIAIGFFMLIERFYHTGTDSRPLVALIVLTGVPTTATLLGAELSWLLPLMYEPPGVALFAVGTLFIYKQRFETIRMTGESEKPALFLDQDNCIRDYNQAASALFPSLDGAIGTDVATINPALAEDHPEDSIISVTQAGKASLYEVSSTPFLSGEVATGRLLTVTDVTTRESYRQQLELKTEQLEALNRVVRHDIRNDMAVILAWAELLQDHIDSEGEDALNRVLKKSKHVIEITELSREFVETLSGEGKTELKPINLDTVLATEIQAVRDSFPDAHFETAGEIPELSVQANQMLSSVFRNLLENAVRHNDKDTPEVTLSCTEQDKTVTVSITDNGKGVPDEQKESIFGKGEKGLDSPGTGLGLYLVETLIAEFGGEVWVEDNDPEGAVFVVELPKIA